MADVESRLDKIESKLDSIAETIPATIQRATIQCGIFVGGD